MHEKEWLVKRKLVREWNWQIKGKKVVDREIDKANKSNDNLITIRAKKYHCIHLHDGSYHKHID